MKPIIKINKLSLLSDNIIGITLFPFILLKDSYYNNFTEKKRKTLINHETIHFKQQIELLVIPFYLWYGIEYCVKFIKYGKKAYNNLSFEREAYVNEDDLNYLETRKLWSFLNYL